MILGNFMVLCEFDPDDVYKWFMELFIDSYDWVMVPNVYGMSQYADGGIMSTKPYISSSNYICKMSDYKKGDWSHVWDGLFWNFMDKHREFFLKNPRMRMLVSSFDKMDHSKKETLLNSAFEFLNTLDKMIFDNQKIDRIIEMAWEDRTPFEALLYQFGLKEQEVIELMRKELKPSSFKLWRKRVQVEKQSI